MVEREPVGLLDTNVIIQFKNLDFRQLPVEAFISSITLGELSIGVALAADKKVSVDRQAHVQFAESRDRKSVV